MKNEESQTPLDAYDYFYCDRCKLIQPLREKPAILGKTPGELQGEYLCEGSFVCHYCGFRRPIRCDACEEVQRVDIEEPYMKNLGDKFLGGDVLCGGCRYIITTLYTLASAA
jgi:hypothetical protein